jgi:hypothetical protein
MRVRSVDLGRIEPSGPAASSPASTRVNTPDQYIWAVTVVDSSASGLRGVTVCLGEQPVRQCGTTDVNGNADVNVTSLPPGRYDIWLFLPGTSSAASCLTAPMANSCLTIQVVPDANPPPQTMLYSGPPPAG